MTRSAVAGTAELARLDLRRDRLMLPVWVYVVTIGVASNAYGLGHLYATAAARATFAASSGHNPSLLFLYGRFPAGPVTLGVISSWRYGVWAALFAALMNVFVVIRHTRADEEPGRGELVGSAAVGRLAGLTAALVTALAANVTLAVLMVVVLVVLGLPAAGSVAFALAVTCCGLAFAGIAAVTAQLAEGARTARGIAIGVLGAAFLLRAVGDASGAGGPSWLSWLSPLGWAEFVFPYSQPRWLVLALLLALAAASVAAAFALAGRRDYGAGLLPARPGPPRAPVWLRGPLGLAWQLQRGTLAAWTGGFAVIFAASGAAAQGIGSLLGGSAQLRQAFTRLGGHAGITNAYLAAIMSLAGLAAAAYATSAVLRLRSEETEGRADPVLATSAGRLRWAFSHLTVAVAGTAGLLAIGGCAAGLGYGLRAGAVGTQVPRLLGAALVQLPAALAVAAVAVAAFGLLPRAAVAGSWAVVGVVLAVDLFGQVLQLPGWLVGVSPFSHVPRLPGVPLTPALGALAWLVLAAAVLAAVGLGGLRVRDVG